jgi:subtilisin-like proprotein convertase family protein
MRGAGFVRVAFAALAASFGLASSSLAQVTAGPSAASAASTSATAIPENYVAHGPVHRVMVPAGSTALDTLAAHGAILRLEDYGSFSVATVNALPVGGLNGLRALDLEVRDEYTLVNLNGYLVDGADSTATKQRLGAIPPELRAPSVAATGAEQRLRLVQFQAPVRDAWLAAVQTTGAEVVTYVPNNAYVVKTDASSDAAVLALAQQAQVLAVTSYEPAFKLRDELRPPAIVDSQFYDVVVQVIADADGQAMLSELYQRSVAVVEEPSQVLNYIDVGLRMDGANVLDIARDPRIFAIEPKLEPRKFDEAQGQIMAGNLNAGGTAPSGPGFLAWLQSKGFPGQNPFPFVVDVTDDGVDRGSLTDVNVEFKVDGLSSGASRLAYNNNYSGDALADGVAGHGNINASIIGGYNNTSGSAYEDASGYQYGLGLAPWVKLGNSKVFSNAGSGVFNQPTATRMANAYNGGARISSNSWGYTSGNTYNADTQAHDTAVRDAVSGTTGNQELAIVFAAGNSGSAASSIHPPGTGKNIFCIGASENFRQTGTDGCAIGNTGADNVKDIISFSGRGPTSDSRKKPDIMAPGTHIEGAASRATGYDGSGVCNQYWPSGQTLYAWSSGTSHSTPAISGACALLRQYFANNALGTPSPAMLKAYLINGASHMTGVGANDALPSNNQGYGLVNLGQSFDTASRVLVDQTQVLGATGGTYTLSGNVVNSALPFRVTLAWTDAPGATTGNAYVNNLDLEVTVNGTLYRGNVFTLGLSTTGGTADARNNVEAVNLPPGTTGSWSITVRATNIAGDGVPGNADTTDQDFALVVYNGSAGAPTPDFTLSATPASQTVTAGGSTTFTVSNSALNGFANNISLSATPAISGVTYGFSPNPMSPNGSSTLTVTTTAGATTGTQTLTITGTDGSITHTTTVSLTINAAPTPDFTLAATPSSQTVTVGNSTTFTVSNTALNGFTGNVTLSATPAISGVTYGFSPNPMSAGGSSTLTVTTTAGATTGTQTLTITGSSGSLTHTTTVSLTINAAPVPDFSLSASPASQTITAGGSTTYTVSTSALNGFSGNVTLAATPAISGVTYAFSPNPVAAGSSSTLTVTTTSGATTGSNTVTITGTSGSLVHSTNVGLTINPVGGGNPVKTYTTTANLAIPDNNSTGVTSTRNVTDALTVSSISVTTAITHTYKGDLVVTLIGPDGTSAILHNRTGGSTDNVNTTFSIATTAAQALTVFNGKSTVGNWSLKVQDLASTDTGTLVSWAITFNGEKSVTANLAIPDNNSTGVTSTLNYTQTGTVAAVRIRTSITHTYKGDLVVTLIAPDGTAVILHNRTGGSTDNVSTEFPDLTAPAQSLNALVGKSIAGNWSLKVQDLASTDTGTLGSWTLSLTAQ